MAKIRRGRGETSLFSFIVSCKQEKHFYLFSGCITTIIQGGGRRRGWKDQKCNRTKEAISLCTVPTVLAHTVCVKACLLYLTSPCDTGQI